MRAKSNSEISSLLRKKDNTFSKKMYFGAIPKEMATDILRETGINVAGYNCSISGNEIRKILKKHGDEKQEKLQGQRAIIDDDFLSIPRLLETAETIRLSEETYEGKPAIIFTSKVNGEISVVAVVSNKHLDLFVQTMYAKNKKGNLATPTVVQATVFTPEAPRGTVSTGTITQPEDSVNQYSDSRKAEDGAKFSIKETEDGRKYVQVDRDILAGVPREEWPKIVRKNMREKFTFVMRGENRIAINQKTRRELTESRDSKRMRSKTNSPHYADKYRASDVLDELVLAVDRYEKEPKSHERRDNIDHFWRGKISIAIEERMYNVDVLVGETTDGNLLLYDVERWRWQKENERRVDQVSVKIPDSHGGSSANTITQPEDFVNQYSDSRKAEDGAKYSISERFYDEFDAWRKEPSNDAVFVLGSTSDVLQGLGAMENDVYMYSEKVNTILHDHPEMTHSEIRRIPEILENPTLILKSQNVGRNAEQNTRLVIFGTIKAQNGQPVMAILDLRPVENKLVIDDMQKTVSAYTKTTNPVDFIKKSEVLYADKKKTTRLLRTIGFQMPIELQKSGFIGSISYEGQKVKMQGDRFRNVFSEDSVNAYSAMERDANELIAENEKLKRMVETLKARMTTKKLYLSIEPHCVFTLGSIQVTRL